MNEQIASAASFLQFAVRGGANCKQIGDFLEQLNAGLLDRINELVFLVEIYKKSLTRLQNEVTIHSGFFLGGDPRNFHPNRTGWTQKQRDNYERDCHRWRQQEYDPAEDWYLAETDKDRYGPGVHLVPTKESKEAKMLLDLSECELLARTDSPSLLDVIFENKTGD